MKSPLTKGENMDRIKIFSGRSHLELAEGICRKLNRELSPKKVEDYGNACLEVILREKVEGCKVFLVQTSVPQTLHTDLEELRQMINAAKENGAKEVIVVMPYVSYARSDKKYASGMAIVAKLMIELLKESGTVKVRKTGKVIRMNKMTRFIGIDFHSKKFEKFLSELDVRGYHLSALPLLAGYLKTKNLQNLILLAGDKGARKKARLLAKKLGIPTNSVGFVDKTRISDTEVRINNIDTEVAGKDVVIFDDEISPVATTLKALTKELEKRKINSLRVAVTHASITQDTIRSLQKLNMIRELIVTDTVPIPEEARRLLPLRVLSVAGLIAEAIKNISREA
jgi:ribose-phosphate pyrophosphokinase